MTGGGGGHYGGKFGWEPLETKLEGDAGANDHVRNLMSEKMMHDTALSGTLLRWHGN